MKKIEVFRISDNKLMAGDEGESVTRASLNVKMKGFNINNSVLYRIEETDTTAENLARKNALIRSRESKIALESYNCGLIDDSTENGKFLKKLCEYMSKR